MGNKEINLKNGNLFIEKYIASKMEDKKIEITTKESSNLMKLIGWFLSTIQINKTFMTNYITTIGTTIYFPEKLIEEIAPKRFMEVVIHECVHAVDEHNNKLLYKPSYLPELFLGLPLLIISIILFILKSWIAASVLLILALLCILPVPKPGRYHWEIRAYSTSLGIAHIFNEDKAYINQIKRWICGQLTGSSYYFTWPFKDKILKDLEINPREVQLYDETVQFFMKDFTEQV
jgi:hypothetical protein